MKVRGSCRVTEEVTSQHKHLKSGATSIDIRLHLCKECIWGNSTTSLRACLVIALALSRGLPAQRGERKSLTWSSAHGDGLAVDDIATWSSPWINGVHLDHKGVADTRVWLGRGEAEDVPSSTDTSKCLISRRFLAVCFFWKDLRSMDDIGPVEVSWSRPRSG